MFKYHCQQYKYLAKDILIVFETLSSLALQHKIPLLAINKCISCFRLLLHPFRRNSMVIIPPSTAIFNDFNSKGYCSNPISNERSSSYIVPKQTSFLYPYLKFICCFHFQG